MVTYQLAGAYYVPVASFKSVHATLQISPHASVSFPLVVFRATLAFTGSEFPLLITKGSINLTH